MITARMREHLEARKPIALLAEIDHPDGMVRLWTKTGTLAYDGHDWDGLGILGRISPIGTSKSLTIQEVAFTLGGVPKEALAFLDVNIRNRVATVWLAGVAAKRRIVADPVEIMEARLDYTTYSVDENGFATVALIGQVGFWTLERAVDLAWSTEEIKKTFEDETGLDLIAGLASAEVIWTPS